MKISTMCVALVGFICLVVGGMVCMFAGKSEPSSPFQKKIARTRSEMRRIEAAIKAYVVDWGSAPPLDSWFGTTTGRRISYFWRALTTPVKYIDGPLRDPFGPHNDETFVDDGWFDNNDPYFQVATGRLMPRPGTGPPGARQTRAFRERARDRRCPFWCIASYGPDYRDDTRSLGSYPYTRHACPYDPTNGIVSRGDIYLHSGKPPTNFLSDRDYDGSEAGFDPWWEP